MSAAYKYCVVIKPEFSEKLEPKVNNLHDAIKVVKEVTFNYTYSNDNDAKEQIVWAGVFCVRTGHLIHRFPMYEGS